MGAEDSNPSYAHACTRGWPCALLIQAVPLVSNTSTSSSMAHLAPTGRRRVAGPPAPAPHSGQTPTPLVHSAARALGCPAAHAAHPHPHPHVAASDSHSQPHERVCRNHGMQVRGQADARGCLAAQRFLLFRAGVSGAVQYHDKESSESSPDMQRQAASKSGACVFAPVCTRSVCCWQSPQAPSGCLSAPQP